MNGDVAKQEFTYMVFKNINIRIAHFLRKGGMNMAIVVEWACTRCGKKVRQGTMPAMTYGGKCPNHSSGLHKWVKTGR